MSKLIPLTQNKFAIVDDKNYEWLMQWKWYAIKNKNTFYAVRNSCYKKGKVRSVLMHRQILGALKGMLTDHINHCGLDNRNKNMRVCTYSQNNQNRQKHKKCSSKYKGVYWKKCVQKWYAHIKLNNKRLFIGAFGTETEAAKAYDRKAKELFSEFANTNF